MRTPELINNLVTEHIRYFLTLVIAMWAVFRRYMVVSYCILNTKEMRVT